MDLKQEMLYSLSDFKGCFLDRSTCDDTWCCDTKLQVELWVSLFPFSSAISPFFQSRLQHFCAYLQGLNFSVTIPQKHYNTQNFYLGRSIVAIQRHAQAP